MVDIRLYEEYSLSIITNVELSSFFILVPVSFTHTIKGYFTGTMETVQFI